MNPTTTARIPARLSIAGNQNALSRGRRYQPVDSNLPERLHRSPQPTLSQAAQQTRLASTKRSSATHSSPRLEKKLGLPAEEIQRRQDFGIRSSNTNLTRSQLQQNAEFARYYEDPVLLTPMKRPYACNDGRVYDIKTLRQLKGQSPFTREMLVGVPDRSFAKAKKQYQVLGYAPPLSQCGLSGQTTQIPVFSTKGDRCDRETLEQSHLQELAEDLPLKSSLPKSTKPEPQPKLLSQNALLEVLSEEAQSSETDRRSRQEVVALASLKINPEKTMPRPRQADLIAEDTMMDFQTDMNESMDQLNDSLNKTHQDMKHTTKNLKEIGEATDRMIGNYQSMRKSTEHIGEATDRAIGHMDHIGEATDRAIGHMDHIGEATDRIINTYKSMNKNIDDYLAYQKARKARIGQEMRADFKERGVKETKEFLTVFGLEPLDESLDEPLDEPLGEPLPEKKRFKFKLPNFKTPKISLPNIQPPKAFKEAVHKLTLAKKFRF